jgi:chromosome segregation ATPase
LQEESQTKCRSLEAEGDDANACIKELVLALGKAELLSTSLTKQLDESQAREVKIKSDYLSASRELQDAQDKILELQRKMEQASRQISKLSDELANKESENAEATAKYRKLESEFRVAQAHISDLDFGKSKLEALLKESKDMLFSSEDNRNKLTSQLDEMQKRLTEKERQYMERGDKLDQQILEVSRLQYQVKDVETSLQKIIDRKSEAISKLESELGLMKKQETLLQEYLTEAKNAAKEIEMNKKQVTAEKCALEAELEGTVVRIRTLEAQLKEAVTGKVHFQAETDVLVPARDDLQRKLVGVELELSAHKDEIEYVTKDSVSLRSALQSEKTARQEAAKKLDLAEEAHKKTEHDLRLIKSDLIQCTTELKTSTVLAKTFEDRLSAANVKVDKLSTELRQYSLKCDALELKTKDAEDGLGSAVETIKKQKAELSSLVDKIEANEREITRLRAHADTLELRLHERNEKERRLQQEIDEIRLSLNLEIKQSAMTQSTLLQVQALNRSLERELDEARNEGYNVKCKFRTVEELDKEHVNKICEMEVELASTRATMKKESSELQQMIVMARMAIEQIHHAVFPKTPTSYASADSKERIAKLEKEVTAEVKNMQNMIVRLQQQANAIPAHVAEIEKLRMQVQNANLAKTFAERQRAEANEIIERLKDELGKNKGKIATLEESLRTARALHAASEKKVHGVQSDLDTTIERNRQELSVLNKEIIQLRELEKDNQMLAEEVRRINEENDSFKQLLKASLAAQEQTAEALCGKFEGRAGPGLLVQVVNGVTRVTSVLPGSCVSNSDSVSGLQLRPGDIIPMLRSGDIIEKVDDVSIAGATLSAVQDLLFGPIESAVTLTFFRNVSGVKSLAEPRFRVTLQRMDTSSHVEGFAQRAHDMCSAAGCLRVKARDLEEKVESVTATLERKEADIRSLHQAREESVKLIYELEQRVRARDIELQVIRAEEVSVRHKLQSAALEIEGLNLQRVKADEVIAFSQHRIKNLDEKNGALERRKKEVTSALEAAERRAASLSDQFSELQNSYAGLGDQIRMVQVLSLLAVIVQKYKY